MRGACEGDEYYIQRTYDQLLDKRYQVGQTHMGWISSYRYTKASSLARVNSRDP